MSNSRVPGDQLFDAQLPALLAEELPPYMPFELVDSDVLAQTQAHASQIAAETPALLPTDMQIVASSSTVVAHQLLAPTGTVSFTLESMAAASVTVRGADDNSYTDLLSINVKFYSQDSSNGDLDAPMVNATSNTDEKAGNTLIRIALAPAHIDKRVHVECEIIVPLAANLAELILRLPTQTRLEIVHIVSPMVKRLDVAMIAGTVRLASISASKIRIAVADGTIDAHKVIVVNTTEFIAISGQVTVSQCALGKTCRFNAPRANVSVCNLQADTVSMQCTQSTLLVRKATAKVITVSCSHGSVTLDNIGVESLNVRTETAPICGSWSVSRSLDVVAQSAIIHGQVNISGSDTRVFAKTSDWPLQLSVNKEYEGSFGIRTVNGVINFGFGNAVVYEQTPNWLYGVVGTGACRLQAENTNSPIVILSR
ncbi:hypothetical protein GGH96_004892 [Coemansia sp. RSA 1972]|nr:hypothetical protein GGH96_004892 [Coemansia sp. RSA 1972]